MRRVWPWAWIVGCVIAVGCATFIVGSDDNRYLDMHRTHRQHCPDPPYALSTPCDNESAVLNEFAAAIQSYHDASKTPGSAARQKARLDAARAAAVKLFPSR